MKKISAKTFFNTKQAIACFIVLVTLLITACCNYTKTAAKSPSEQQTIKTASQNTTSVWIKLGRAWQNYQNNGLNRSTNANKVSQLLSARQLEDKSSEAAKLVMEMIYSSVDNPNEILNSQLQKGEASAIRLAFKLFTISDGAFTEILLTYLGNVIHVRPIILLTQMDTNGKNCSPLRMLDVDYYVDNLDKELEELKRREKVLEKIEDSSVIKIRDKCLTMIRDDIAKTARIITETANH